MARRLSIRKKHQLLQEIEELLARLSIPLRYEKGDFRGGLCRLNDRICFILNKKLSIDQKLQIMQSDLRLLDLDDVYIRPALREFLESEPKLR